MRKISLYVFLFVVLFTSFSLNAQTYSTGRETKMVDVNFTELSNYLKEHPSPLIRRMPLNEDEGDEAPRPSRHKIAPSEVRLIDRNRTDRITSGALLPVSPAPNDTFLSTGTNGDNIPPDTHGAVDSEYCLTATNTYFHIQKRTGANVSEELLGDFWTTLLPSLTGPDEEAYDPRIHFDPYYNRWIFVTDAVNGNTMGESYILIAVSATNSPTGTWHEYSVSIDATNATWLDFPCVGFNSQWITVSGNMFTAAGAAQGAVLYVFNYADIMAGTGAPFTKITENRGFSICPAMTYDNTQLSMFCITKSNPSTGKLQLYKITGPVGAPVIASVGYPTTTTFWQSGGSNDFVPQRGTTDKLQAGDGRIYNFTYRNQKLWCAHTVFLPATGRATRCSVMWWEVDTLGNPVQNGLIDDPVTPSFYDYPSISVNENNDALVGFSYCSANTYPNAAYALHLHTDASDSMRPPFVFRHGQTSYYQTFGGTQNRWGDYSASCVDPKNSLDFWTIQETVPSSSVTPAVNWETWWAYVKVCPATASYTVTKSIINKNLNDTINFTGSDPAGTIFTWNYGGGTVVSGSGAGPIVLKWPTYGWKVITLKDSIDGCSETFVDSVLVENEAGVKQVSAGNESVKIVPNPNNGAFDILFDNPMSGAVSVNLLNEQGQLVYKEQWNTVYDNKVSVKTDDLPPGTYIANIYIGGNVITQKITITR